MCMQYHHVHSNLLGIDEIMYEFIKICELVISLIVSLMLTCACLSFDNSIICYFDTICVVLPFSNLN